ncbi:MAG: exo-alpha-sialidase [Clostridia bacterium]|nr:exo-alpha-sialidase [Clostridia bacterium]
MNYCVNARKETVVFEPGQNSDWYAHGVFYGRGLQLQTDEAGDNKGKLYATSEYYYYPGKWGSEHFPIFESGDGGETWQHISDIYDMEFNAKKWMKAEDGTYCEVPLGADGATALYNQHWSMIFQPQLFELPKDIGNLKKGTVICGGVTKTKDHCAIVVYYSVDGLKKWKYLSAIAFGGKEQMCVGSAIWEPFFVYENNALYCFFSDERGMMEGGQKLVLSKTTDGINWGECVDVCNFKKENGKFRPGMSVVTKLPDGRYFMVYEGVNIREGKHPVYYKITDNIECWRPAERADGIMPEPFDCGSPYCITLTDGTVVVGAHGTNKVAINTDSLKTHSWTFSDTNIGNAYTRCLVPLLDNKFMVVSAGAYGAPDPHKLSISIESIY